MSKDHPCFVLVPMRYGSSGRPVPPEVFVKIAQVLNRQFGGHTPIGETRSPPGIRPGGQWIDPDTNETIYDVSWMLKVAVHPEKLDTFRTVVRAIGRELEQKVMYVEILPPSTEFLSVFDGNAEPCLDDLLKLLDTRNEEDADQATA